MDTVQQLVEWAESQGVQMNGVAPVRIPGRGVGIVATRDIKPKENILEVPTSCLRSINTVPRALRAALPPDMSVHGLLAADMALEATAAATQEEKRPRATRKRKQGEDSSDNAAAAASLSSSTALADCYPAPSPYAPWNAVLPTPADLASMPLVWPPALQALLPGPAAKLLAAQQAKLARDWAAVRAAGVLASEPDAEIPGVYRHAWLLANTRTFYYEAPPTPTSTPAPATSAGGGAAKAQQRRRKKQQQQQQQTANTQQPKKGNHEDNMALQPVADLFNHDGAAGCSVAFDTASFVVRAARAHAAGEEARIRYGRHGGDFLAVEYGFVPDGGDEWDEVGIDEVILPLLEGPAAPGAGAEEDAGQEDAAEGAKGGRKRKRKADAGKPTAEQQRRRQRRAARWRDRLEARGFLGGYVLDQRTVCYRTQVALRALLALEASAVSSSSASSSEVRKKKDKKEKGKGDGEDTDGELDDDNDAWSRFVDGLDDGEAEQPAADALLARLLEAYQAGPVAERIRRVESKGGDLRKVGEPCQRALLTARWKQVDQLLGLTIERLRGAAAVE